VIYSVSYAQLIKTPSIVYADEERGNEPVVVQDQCTNYHELSDLPRVGRQLHQTQRHH
jgi:hypothetical protein